MARLVDPSEGKTHLTRTTAKYPWDLWLNGSQWELSNLKDFDLATESFRTMAYRAAKKRGKRVRIYREMGSEFFYVQAYPLDSSDG